MRVEQAVRAIFGQFVAELGGVDATAATLGQVRGTISRKQNGSLPITVSDIDVLQSSVGRYPVTQLLMSRMGQHPIPVRSIQELVADIAAESGEAVAAVIKATAPGSEGGVDLSEKERAQCIAELRQAHEKIEQLLAILEGDGDA